MPDRFAAIVNAVGVRGIPVFDQNKIKKFKIKKTGSYMNQQFYKRYETKSLYFRRVFPFLFYMVGGGVYSNVHLNIRHHAVHRRWR